MNYSHSDLSDILIKTAYVDLNILYSNDAQYFTSSKVKMHLIAMSNFKGMAMQYRAFFMLIKCLQTICDPIMNGEINPIPKVL